MSENDDEKPGNESGEGQRDEALDGSLSSACSSASEEDASCGEEEGMGTNNAGRLTDVAVLTKEMVTPYRWL